MYGGGAVTLGHVIGHVQRSEGREPTPAADSGRLDHLGVHHRRRRHHQTARLDTHTDRQTGSYRPGDTAEYTTADEGTTRLPGWTHTQTDRQGVTDRGTLRSTPPPTRAPPDCPAGHTHRQRGSYRPGDTAEYTTADEGTTRLPSWTHTQDREGVTDRGTLRSTPPPTRAPPDCPAGHTQTDRELQTGGHCGVHHRRRGHHQTARLDTQTDRQGVTDRGTLRSTPPPTRAPPDCPAGHTHRQTGSYRPGDSGVHHRRRGHHQTARLDTQTDGQGVTDRGIAEYTTADEGTTRLPGWTHMGRKSVKG